MSQKRLTHLLGILACLVIALLAWLGANAIGAGTSSTEAQAETINQQNTSVAAQIESLHQAEKDLSRQTEELKKLELAIPSDPNYGAFLAELQSLAASSGLSVSNVNTDQPEAYVSAAAGDTAATGDASTTETAPTAGADGAGAATPVSPLGGSNLYGVPVRFTVAGESASFDSFIAGLKNGNRLFSVNAVTLSSEAGNAMAGPMSAEVSGYIWVIRPN